MLLLISPAKTMDYTSQGIIPEQTEPVFQTRADELADIMQRFSYVELQRLMGISKSLAQQNVERFQTWKFSSAYDKKQALFAFKGDVYVGLDAETLSHDALQKLQRNLRILSGLYGVLKPFDMILPHRLEMGTDLKNSYGKDLYAFWNTDITDYLLADIQLYKHTHVINLASQEYFKSVHTKKLSIPVITPVFKDYKNGQLKMISFYAKKARGLMVRYIAEHSVTKPEHLLGFDYDGYCFNQQLSDETTYVFTR